MNAPDSTEETPLMPVRRLHNYTYCPRLFYLQWVEGIFEENADTVAGSSMHRQVDKPSAADLAETLELPPDRRIRSLALDSGKLGLTGVIDVVEGSGDGLRVLDYKKGRARRDEQGNRIPKEADAVQVVAYALLLEANGHQVAGAEIYYGEDRRRVEVSLDEEQRAHCRNLLRQARATARSATCPDPLVDDVRCLHCSAYPVCLPNESAFWKQSSEENAAPPKDLPPPRPPGEEREILLVHDPKAKVGRRGERFVVSVQGEKVASTPVNQTRGIYLYGNPQISTQALHACLDAGIEVAHFSAAGRFLGMTAGLPASGVDARLGQYRLFGAQAPHLPLAREIIRAKIHNQRVMLMRNGSAAPVDLKEMERLRDKAPHAENAEKLLGLEGAAAAIYFRNFHTMLKEKLGDFQFTSRNRRPPRDPVNALLSMGYSLLAKELAGICHAVGLDPFLGFYHRPRYGRPALALDLMEEFRPLVADSVALALVNRRELVLSDFIRSSRGVFLNKEGRRSYWESYFRRLDSEVRHPQFGYRMTYRRMFEVQARQLHRYVTGDAPRYHGFTTR